MSPWSFFGVEWRGGSVHETTFGMIEYMAPSLVWPPGSPFGFKRCLAMSYYKTAALLKQSLVNKPDLILHQGLFRRQNAAWLHSVPCRRRCNFVQILGDTLTRAIFLNPKFDSAMRQNKSQPVGPGERQIEHWNSDKSRFKLQLCTSPEFRRARLALEQYCTHINLSSLLLSSS